MVKATKQKHPKGRIANHADEITDPRFANIQNDPRFRLPSKNYTRVKLDDRFSKALKDDEYSRKASVDKYGRKLPSNSGRKELERLYRVEETPAIPQVSDDDVLEDDHDHEVLRELERLDSVYDPARDGGFSESSSDDSAESDEDEEEEQEVDVEEEVFGFPDTYEQGHGEAPMGDISSRIAAVNMDWDNIRATDLIAVFSSFCPPGGRIENVRIYPSEFGKARMEREEVEGPPREIFISSNRRLGGDGQSDEDSSSEVDENERDEKIRDSLLKEDKGEEFSSAKLRRYQLERLRYYYAVLTFSSAETAKAIYDATDGTEYLTTANFFDLRFIPDDVSFDEDDPRDECAKIPDGYRPNSFVTDALQHSKVRLTWDADDVARKESVKRAFTGSRQAIDQNDLKAYLGSDSSEEEFEDAANSSISIAAPVLSKKDRERQRLRAALGLAEESVDSSLAHAGSRPVGDMQITFSSGLTSKDGKGSVFENEPELNETTVAKYVRKEKERKQRRKEKMKAARDAGDAPPEDRRSEILAHDDNQGEDRGFDDPFFAADPSDAALSKSKTQRKAARLARRAEREAEEEVTASKRAELELLMEDETEFRGDIKKTSHFDIDDILKAEKAARKKRKGKGKKEKALKGGDVQEEVELDVQDSRFSSLFGSHDYAIDPTNPKFRNTAVMKAVVKEGRRKRRREEDLDVHQGPDHSGGKRRKDATIGAVQS